MAQSVREADTKTLLAFTKGLLNAGQVLTICGDSDLDGISGTHTWLTEKQLVVKPDVLLKRRGVGNLVHLNISLAEAKEKIKLLLGSEIKQEGLTGACTHLIVEPYYPHDPENDELYIAFRTLAEGDEILFHHRGGINVGDVEKIASKTVIPLFSQEIPNLSKLVEAVPNSEVREALKVFIPDLYESFCANHFAFLEINPFCYDSNTKKFVFLDAAGKLDHTADFLCDDRWYGASTDTSCSTTDTYPGDHPSRNSVSFPSPFGRVLTAHEEYVRELDAKTGASLKLTVLNPRGRIWTMIAGGGASVVYTDTLCEFGAADELANYGEYSGAPSEMTTYEYAKTVLDLVTTNYREEGKILLIGGGIANFTSVADTFRGIITALREFRTKLADFKVQIYVRRGGPSYQDGLKLMTDLGKEISIPIKVYGPETFITAIIPIAMGHPEAADPQKYGWTTSASSDCERTIPKDVLDLPVFKQAVENIEIFRSSEMKHLSHCLFGKETRSFVWGLQTRAVQEMLDFDHVCGRSNYSVCALIYEFSVSHLRSFYFGTEEIFIPVCQSLEEATEKFPDTDTLINFASMRSAYDVTMNAMNFSQIKKIAVIAEGVPERKAREMGYIARSKGVTIIGPATVGGIRSGGFRIGNTGGSLENIMNAKLYRPGSIGFVTKSGGMLNEMNNILSTVADGACEGIAVGGDRFPATSMLSHLMRFQQDPHIHVLVLLGEVGGVVEYDVAAALKTGLITKPLIAWCVGTCASMLTTEVSFGHAGAWAGSDAEQAKTKNAVLAAAGARVPTTFSDIGIYIKRAYEELISKGTVERIVEPAAPRVPMDYAWAKKLGLVRRPKGFVSSISDDRGEELVYAGWPISKVLQSNMGVGGVIALLWFKRPMPDYCYRYLERVLMLTGDHGPAVCGAHNTIVAARAGKDLISSLIAGLCTIGDRFGGACDQAAQQFYHAYNTGLTPEEFVKVSKSKNQLIMGIGHRIKSVNNPDMRVQLLKKFCKANFKRTPLIDFAEKVEKVTTKKKDTLILNVDGLIGVSMCDMLFYCGVFNPTEAKDYIDNGCINGLFVLGRSIGFIGHYLDQKRLKQGLYRHDVDDIAYVLPELRQHCTN